MLRYTKNRISSITRNTNFTQSFIHDRSIYKRNFSFNETFKSHSYVLNFSTSNQYFLNTKRNHISIPSKINVLSSYNYISFISELAPLNPKYALTSMRFKRVKHRKVRATVALTSDQKLVKQSKYKGLMQKMARPNGTAFYARRVLSAVNSHTLYTHGMGRRTRQSIIRYLEHLTDRASGRALPTSGEIPTMTPLYRIQKEAKLPKSPEQSRFDFPHLLVFSHNFNPATVNEDYSGKFNQVSVIVDSHNCTLDLSEAELMRDVAGPASSSGQFVQIYSDSFKTSNENAALVGDMLERLIRKVKEGMIWLGRK